MTLRNLLSMDLKFLLVGGKGGVGKTSVASALAISLAEEGKKVLLISTDPAHSISDSFALDFSSGDITKVEGIDGELFVLEINPDAAGEEMSKSLGMASLQSDQLTNLLGGQGLSELQGLGEDLKEIPPPGMDEALSFAKILEYSQNDDYDTIVLDTAPTGHTLRLLNLPEFLDSFIGRMLKMKAFISNAMGLVKSLFGGKRDKDTTIEKLEAMKEKIMFSRDLLMDPLKTQFVIVMIPTLMSVFESERLSSELKDHLISNKFSVINMLNPDNPRCKHCSQRRQEQLKNVEYINSVFSKQDIKVIETFENEIRGIDMLRSFASGLLNEE